MWPCEAPSAATLASDAAGAGRARDIGSPGAAPPLSDRPAEFHWGARFLLLTLNALPMPRLLALSVLALLALRTWAVTPPVNEYDLLRRLPPDLFARLTDTGEPDERGFVGAHREHDRWLQAGRQRSGCWYLIGAVVQGDLARAERGWKSIEATFAHQEADGGFVATQQPNKDRLPTHPEKVETAFFYLQELGHALLVLEQSPLAPRFSERVAALKPQIRRAMDYVLAGHDTILPKVGHTANRLLIAAKAYGLCGVLLDHEPYREKARELIGHALRRRDADGVFLEAGGRDSSYNAVSLLFGRTLWLHLPHEELGQALDQAMVWQLTRILPDGRVRADGNTRTGVDRERTLTGGFKQINRREVALALCLHGLVHDEPALIELAGRVLAPAPSVTP